MWWHILYHLALIPAAILAYYFSGLMAAGIVPMAMLASLIVFLKATGKKVEPIYLLELGLLISFGTPAIFMNTGPLVKLNETISGLIMGVSFFTWSFLKEKSVVKSLIPGVLVDYFAQPHPKFQWYNKLTQNINHYLVNTPESTWKKIDYMWAAEMTLSAGISLAVALIFPMNVWFYAKYIIGPVLTSITLTAQAVLMHQTVKQAPLFIPSSEKKPLLDPNRSSEPAVTQYSSALLYQNYFGKDSRSVNGEEPQPQSLLSETNQHVTQSPQI